MTPEIVIITKASNVLNCLGKLIKNALSAGLYTFCEDNSIFRENQAGFRETYFTIDHIFLLKYIDLYCFKKENGSFIDYSKLFDTVWRDALFN